MPTSFKTVASASEKDIIECNVSSHFFDHGLISSLLKTIKAIIYFLCWYTRIVYRSPDTSKFYEIRGKFITKACFQRNAATNTN